MPSRLKLIPILLTLFVFSAEAALTPQQKEICILTTMPALTKEFADAEKLAMKKSSLLKKREFWSNAMGRRVSQGEYEHMKLTRFIRKSIRTERPYIIVDHLRPNAHQTLLAFFSIRENTKALAKVMEDLARNPGDSQLLRREAELRKKILNQGKRFANSYDRYKTGITYLEAIAKNAESAEAPAAKNILASLDSEKILESFFRQSRIGVEKSPSLVELSRLYIQYPEFELRRLRKLRNQEMIAAFFAFSPTAKVYDAIKTVARKFPGTNEEKLTAFFMSLESGRMKYIYGPDIERIAVSKGTPSEQLSMLESLNAETNDELLITFARRVDHREAWEKLLETAQTRTNTDFHGRMERAKSIAVRLGDLSDEGRSSGFGITTRFLDFAVASVLGYYGYGVITDAVTNDTPEEDAAVPTEAEEAEIDQLTEQAEQVLREAKKVR